jgi:hypothetical protein
VTENPWNQAVSNALSSVPGCGLSLHPWQHPFLSHQLGVSLQSQIFFKTRWRRVADIRPLFSRSTLANKSDCVSNLWVFFVLRVAVCSLFSSSCFVRTSAAITPPASTFFPWITICSKSINQSSRYYRHIYCRPLSLWQQQLQWQPILPHGVELFGAHIYQRWDHLHLKLPCHCIRNIFSVNRLIQYTLFSSFSPQGLYEKQCEDENDMLTSINPKQTKQSRQQSLTHQSARC